MIYALKYIPNDTAIISITDPILEHINIDKNFKNVLKMKFWDIEEDFGNYKTLSEKQAKEIYNFINLNIDKKFIINCEAGQSRSSAIAVLVEIMTRDKILFPKPSHAIIKTRNHWRYTPNPYVISEVYKLINAEYEQKIGVL